MAENSGVSSSGQSLASAAAPCTVWGNVLYTTFDSIDSVVWNNQQA